MPTRIHGLKESSLYAVWRQMKQRCYNPRTARYPLYGGRGIQVCDEWRCSNGFVAFHDWAVANGYQVGLTIDRIDNNGHYEPTNCRWVPDQQQRRNKRTNHLLTAFGETKCMVAWLEDARCVVCRGTLKKRIKLGWDHQRALTQPSR